MEIMHDNLENVFYANPMYPMTSQMTLPEIDTSAASFYCFMANVDHNTPSKQSFVAIQNETSPRVTTMVQNEFVFAQTIVVVSNTNTFDFLHG